MQGANACLKGVRFSGFCSAVRVCVHGFVLGRLWLAALLGIGFLLWAICGSASAQSLETAAACLESKNCAGSYGERIRAMQASLVTLYERALAEGQAKEHMANLENCLRKLTEVFRFHVAELALPGADDVVKAAQSMLEEVCEGLCRDTLERLEQEKREWTGIWDDLHRSLLRQTEDWTRITRSLELGNIQLMESMRSRLRELLP